MQLNSIENIVFDFDHTLIDTDKAFAAYSQQLADQLQKFTGLNSNVISAAIAETTVHLETQFFAGRLDLIKHDVVSDRLQKLSDVDRHQITAAVKGSYHDALRVTKPILLLLNQILRAGKQVYVFTGGSPAHTKDKLIASDLWQYFNIIFTGDIHTFEDCSDSGVFDEKSKPRLRFLQKVPPVISLGPNPKSSAAGYHMLIERARLDASRTLMIGNHLRDDIQSAQLAGLKTAQATWFNLDKTENVAPDMVLKVPELVF